MVLLPSHAGYVKMKLRKRKNPSFVTVTPYTRYHIDCTGMSPIMYDAYCVNGSQLVKIKKKIPHMPLP